jgi:hypothetical protein
MMMHLHQLCMVAIIELQTLHKKTKASERRKKISQIPFRKFSFHFFPFWIWIEFDSMTYN